MDVSAQNLTEVIHNYNPREQIIILIMNTLHYYKENERSIYEGKAYYKHPLYPETRDAVGRFIEDDKYNLEIENQFIGNIKEYIHPKLHPLVDSGDLAIIAQLHNFDEYWKGNQLSMNGLHYIGYMYGLNKGELYTILSVYKKQN